MKTMNPELLPLIEWWEKDGKQTVALALVAAVAVGGWYGWKAHNASVKAAATQSLVNADTTEELEESVAKFGSTATGGALNLRLAKRYFDDARYEEALAIYDSLEKKPVEGFADIPAVGRAQCLEGLKRFAEAQAAFDAFAEANPKHYLTLTAQLGAVRCVCQAGDQKAALERIAALKASVGDDTVAKTRIDATEELVKRFTK